MALPRSKSRPRRNLARLAPVVRSLAYGVRNGATVKTTMRTAITLTLPEPAYLRCLRVLGAWWCLGSSALAPRVLMPYVARP
jgi:hypothetical protein